MNKLTNKQLLFCEYYVDTFNARKSALKAGYDEKYSHTNGYRLLKNKAIKRQIQLLKNERKVDITKDDIVKKLVDIAYSDTTDYVDYGYNDFRNYVQFKDSKKVDGTLIQEVSMGKDGAKIKILDKMKALEMLIKINGLTKMDSHKIKLDIDRLNLDKERLKNESNNTESIDNIKIFLEATKSSKEDLDELFKDDVNGSGGEESS
jgi:phage terminase small subunit